MCYAKSYQQPQPRQSILNELFAGSLSLRVKYTPQYPDELPEFDIDVLEGKISSDQKQQIMDALKASVSSNPYRSLSLFFSCLHADHNMCEW